MPDDSIYHLNLIIDDLTNSIRQVNNGESFETDIALANGEDIKSATKKTAGIFHRRLNLTRLTVKCIN